MTHLPPDGQPEIAEGDPQSREGQPGEAQVGRSDTVGGKTVPARSGEGVARIDEEAPGMADLLLRATMLAKFDLGAARGIVAEAKGRLPGTEMEVLLLAIRSATKLSAAVAKALLRDVDAFDGRFGYVVSADDLAKALEALLRENVAEIIAVEGAIWVYPTALPTRTGAMDTHFWQMVTRESFHRLAQRELGTLPITHNQQSRNAAFELIAARHAGADDYFSAAAPVLNLDDSVLVRNIETGVTEVLAHDAIDRARYKLAVKYDGTAVAPTFLAGLTRIMGGDQKKVECFLEFMAACLFGLRPARDDVRSILFLVGPQRSGKSTLIRILEAFVPDYARQSIPPDRWSEDYFLASLRNIRLNTVTELAAGKVISGASIKRVSSREAVEAREPYGRPFKFRPTAFHVFASNHVPAFDETDGSIERRFAVLKMAGTISDEELQPDFEKQVWVEAPGIVNLLVECAMHLTRVGRFTLPDDHEELAIRMLHRDQPAEVVARAWVERHPGGRVPSWKLQQAMRLVAGAAGADTTEWPAERGMKTLAMRLRAAYGAEIKQDNGRTVYTGIRFKAGFAERIPDAKPKRPGLDDL